MSVGESVRGFVEVTRPGNAVASGVLTWVGAFVAGVPASWNVAAAVVATILAVGAGNSINDYFDRDIDAINAPERPIPRGAVTPRGVLAFSAVQFAVAIAFALTLPVTAIVIASINLAALMAYTSLFKGLPGAGNAVVAYLGGSTFLFGAAAVGNPLDGVVLFALAALSTFTREVVKDVEDVAGDREEGLNTLPIAVGARAALWVGVACLAVAVLASPLPYLRGTFGLPYLVVVAPADVAMLAAAYRAFDDPTTGQSWLKYGMFLAIVAFVVGRAWTYL